MNQIIKSMLFFLLIVTSFAFRTSSDKGVKLSYGVSENNPSGIALHLAKDYSFTYKDLSDPEQPIHVSGTYTLVNDKVALTANETTIKFHDQWKLSEDRKIAKSRKGLAFYKLHRTK